jgi:hypothetical protein
MRAYLRSAGAFGSLVAILVRAAPAAGGTVPISGYDVLQTPASGFGYWYHSYTGTIAPTGRTYSGSWWWTGRRG